MIDDSRVFELPQTQLRKRVSYAVRHLLWIAAVVVLVVAMSAFSVPGWFLGVVVVATLMAEYAILWAPTVALARWARTRKR